MRIKTMAAAANSIRAGMQQKGKAENDLFTFHFYLVKKKNLVA